jgi:hypothetical protein
VVMVVWGGCSCIANVREALGQCCDWLWEKHMLLTSESRPAWATIESTGFEALHEVLHPHIGHIVRP